MVAGLGPFLLARRGLLAPIVAAWGAVSGSVLLAQGLRCAACRTWRQASGTPPQDP